MIVFGAYKLLLFKACFGTLAIIFAFLLNQSKTMVEIVSDTTPNFSQNLNQNSDFDALMAFTEYFEIYFYIHFCSTTLQVLFLLYLILFVTPKEMCIRIKPLLINFAINNYAFILVFFLWQPIPISPFFGGFCVGVLKYLGNLNRETIDNIYCNFWAKFSDFSHFDTIFQFSEFF